MYNSSMQTLTYSITENTSISDDNWSGDHCSWMCVSWTCKVHHYTVNVLLYSRTSSACVLHMENTKSCVEIEDCFVAYFDVLPPSTFKELYC